MKDHIEIQDIAEKFPSDIVNLLLDMKKQPFEIWIPKETVLFGSESGAIAIDYLQLAYSGQLLNSVATKFEYQYVPPSALDNVLFKVETHDLEGLAQALFEISFGYVNDFEDEIYSDNPDYELIFQEGCSQFEGDVEEGVIEPICYDFYADYIEFSDEEEGDDSIMWVEK